MSQKNRIFKIEETTQTVLTFSEHLGRGISLDLVLVSHGRFLMGSPGNELERRSSECPQHNVTIPHFLMGQYPVTQLQWQVVAEWQAIDRALKPNPSSFKGGDRPVENISWLDAVEFCKRLSAKTERPYRLPSEAEWEYACRAGTDTPFYFGETLTPELANYDWNYIYGDYGVEKLIEADRGTMSVDSFPANGYGLCDMHGNIWEWCEDDWHGDYAKAPIDGSAWNTISHNSRLLPSRVLRGGSWIYEPGKCRSASRNFSYEKSSSHDYGFRVVCAPSRRA